MTYPYSEIFYSIQGEGIFTGVPTVWLRYFGCNLQCNGFGQKEPTKPETWALPYQDFDVSTVERVEDLPVWSLGCDSSYSWSAKYKHLAKSGTPEEIAQLLINEIPGKDFELPYGDVHLCFTGGEPMIPRSQECTRGILDALMEAPAMFPKNITFETNGTKPIVQEKLFEDYRYMSKFLFSVSPKLFTVSGETNAKAIRPEIVHSYTRYGKVQLKFVCGDRDDQWEELLRVADQYRREGLEEIWVMPVGATAESQDEIAGRVATRAIQQGFKVSARVHCYLWGNVIGV